MSVNIWDGEKLVPIAGGGGNQEIQEKLAELETLIEQTRQLRASLESYGMVKLSSANDITDSAGLALPVTEKNPDIQGSIMSILSGMTTDKNGFYKLGPFFVYFAQTQNKHKIKINRMNSHETCFFFGESNNSPFSGVTTAFETLLNKTAERTNVFISDDKIIFDLDDWSGIFLIVTEPLQLIEVE